jgi:hypothetical protein
MICRSLVLGTVVLAGCADVTNGPATDPSKTLDETVFDCNVQPILVRQCSYIACHGRADAALRVYSPGKLRATPPQDLDDLTAPLGSDEAHANFLSATGFAATASDPMQNYLLLKPLPSSAGGYEHAGGAIYAGGTSDPQYVAIRAWLSGSGACAN